MGLTLACLRKVVHGPGDWHIFSTYLKSLTQIGTQSMPERTVKGATFTIIVGDKRIRVEHVYGKGKRCRISAPPGVVIEPSSQLTLNEETHSEPPILESLRQSLMNEDDAVLEMPESGPPSPSST